jgi:hypothetical protein
MVLRPDKPTRGTGFSLRVRGGPARTGAREPVLVEASGFEDALETRPRPTEVAAAQVREGQVPQGGRLKLDFPEPLDMLQVQGGLPSLTLEESFG